MKALSIVLPNGTRIARGFKTIEVRSWKPTIDFENDFLIVENDYFLKESSVDNNGPLLLQIIEKQRNLFSFKC